METLNFLPLWRVKYEAFSDGLKVRCTMKAKVAAFKIEDVPKIIERENPDRHPVVVSIKAAGNVMLGSLPDGGGE